MARQFHGGRNSLLATRLKSDTCQRLFCTITIQNLFGLSVDGTKPGKCFMKC